MKTENIHEALGVFLEAMRPYTVSLITRYFPSEPWEGVFFKRLTPTFQKTWNDGQRQGTEPELLIDYNNLTFLPNKFREELTKDIGGDKAKTYSIETCLSEIKGVRNKCQHFAPITEDEIERTFSNMKQVANILGMPDLRKEVERLRDKQTYTPAAVAPSIPVTTVTSSPANVHILDDGSPLRPWFQNCIPHFDIRSGKLDESVFAANLNDVVMGVGPEVYRDPVTFFKKTYVTAGLRDITKRVVTALNGMETENRVISLQTGFGGGKTHTLISLYHIIKCGSQLLQMESCANILPADAQPQFENAKVAVFTNDTNDIVQGRTTEEGITIHTLWGEIAYQLGGVKGYEQVRRNDEDRIAPSAPIFKPILIEAKTSLILIDELADYCIKAASKKGRDGYLYDQTVSFMQTLTQVVSSVPRCVLIATLPASKSEMANSELGQKVLDALHDRIVRIGTGVKPVDDEEVYEVIRRRLFDQINDEQVVDLVAKRYKDMYHNRRTDLPERCDKLEYANKIKKSYPFHPELIDMFRNRWGSDSKFQRTRGVLRLLASIVQDLWKRKDSLNGPQALIHTSDVYLENLNSLTGTITNLMGSNWDSVMTADVYGTSSNARIVDEMDPQSNLCQYRLTQGIATTLLMASVGVKQKGLSIKELKLCLLRPKTFNHNDVDGALNKLEQRAHYLHTSKVGEASYWFESKANVNILLQQAKAEIKDADVEAEILKRLQISANYIQGKGLNVLVAPTGDVPEQKSLTLVIMSPSYAQPTSGKSSSLEHAINQIARKKGNSDRIYRNTIFYLVCSEAGRAALNNQYCDLLACNKILEEYAGRLEADQKQDIQSRKKEYDRQVDSALIRAYNIVAKSSVKNGVEYYEMKAYAMDFSSQVRQNMMGELEQEEWILKSIGRAKLYGNNLLPEIERPINVQDLYETFLRFDDKPMIASRDAIRNTVNKYCQEGLFNVGVGIKGKYTKIYHNEEVPFMLECSWEDLWLLDPSIVMKPESSTETASSSAAGTEFCGGISCSTGVFGGSGSSWGTSGNETTNPLNSDSSENEVKTYSKVTISGSVPMENWVQLFPSFITTLKKNNLEIEVKFTAKSTEQNPLTENSPTFKSIKESASQLGLDFEMEE